MADYTIWKYDASQSEFSLEVPRGAKLLSLQIQHGAAVLWFLVDPERGKETRRFYSAGTGNPIPEIIAEKLHFIGTIQHLGGTFIQHLFEIIEDAPKAGE